MAFLEDDDLWLAGKIGRIQQAFSEHSRLVYYHNQYVAVNEKGERLGVSIEIPGRSSRLPTRPFVFDTRSATYSQIRRAASWGLGVGLSSIVVRRRLLVENLELLRDIRLSVDQCLCHLAMASGDPVMYDPSSLTAYRVHAENAMLHGQEADTDLSGLRSARADLDKIFLRDQRLTLERMTSVSSRNVQRALACLIAEGEVYVDFLSEDGSKPVLAHHVLDYLSTTSASDFPYSALLASFGVLNLASPRIAGYLYARWAASNRLS